MKLKGAIAFATATAAVSGFAAYAEVKPMDVRFEDGMVAQSLTGQAGDPVAGRDIFMNRKLGNCLACHVNSDIPEQPFHGEVGPALDGAGDRWEEGDLRGIVSNAKNMFPDSIMPAFYIDSGYTRPLEDFEGTSILTAQEVEDVVAYLLTLKE